jgi:hypothetical protein
LRGETGDQTDQESRTAEPRAAPSMAAMDITIHMTFLPHDDESSPLRDGGKVASREAGPRG